MLKDEWKNLYPSQWKGLIVDDAIVHPAKFSSKLIKHIYDHLFEEGWLKECDVVIDPFGGVALGALHAMRLGCAWRGVELEQKFVELGEQNIREWNERFDLLPMWNGDARIIQGDSRELLKVLGSEGNVSVSSPAYGAISVEKNAERSIDLQKQYETYKKSGGGQTYEAFCETQRKHSQGYGSSDGQLSAMPLNDASFQASISSPPFRQSEGGTPEPKEGGVIDKALYERHKAGNAAAQGYGESDANLGNMRANDDSFIVAVSSPPFAGTGVENDGRKEILQKGFNASGVSGSRPNQVGDYKKKSYSDNYGSTEGQLGAMKAQGFDAAVSSPPFEATEGAMNSRKFKDPEKLAKDIAEKQRDGTFKNANYASPEAIMRGLEKANNQFYGDTAGNIGNNSGDDFWLAARTIVEQVYQALVPGGHAVWVVKDFVKNKQRVPFCDQWRQLCEAVGFVTLHEHHAMLVHRKGTQKAMFGDDVEIKTESKSFFRRLAEKNGSPRIDWEVIWCMEKLKE